MPIPAFLSKPLANGFQRKRADRSRSIEMDSGHTRRRPIFRSAPETLTLSWMCTQTEFDAFDAWFETELKAGTEAFDFTLLGETKRALFVEQKYSAEQSGETMAWRITAKVQFGNVRVAKQSPVNSGAVELIVGENRRTVLSMASLTSTTTDADEGGSLTVVSISNVSAGITATLGVEGVSIVPDEDFIGSAGFDYEVANASGATVMGRCNLTVQFINQPCLLLEFEPYAYTPPAGSAADLTLAPGLGPYVAPPSTGCAL